MTIGNVDVSEAYSPPRIVPAAERIGLKGGTSFDITHPDPETGKT